MRDDPDYVCGNCGHWADKMDGCDCLTISEEDQADDRRDMMQENEN